MAELKTVARPYAKAAFEVAREQGHVAEWANMLSILATVTKEPKLKTALGNPAFSAQEKASALAQVCEEITTEQGKAFLLNLAENKRLLLLPAISELFQQFKLNYEKAVDVKLTSAFELSAEQAQTLADSLAKKLDRTINLTNETDASLIGGVVIRTSDLIIDGSVRGKLTKLAEAINS
ncbi:ATP synthase subunit delta [Marinomonas spartinae]|uniref:ATP synthase subunit delta n=1 Tax=Marinomonas spartinae TaxID=1792290 RepID=A0A1A8SZX8_9GAMM|nr:F0F1 ATP synthase subunit delta [Marinomonas spartinae]SBS25071.1 ATP synthase subunit delta [Marinomonas spartinae]SBS25077.1 ATP synthase subunit delta [Marinomonas spartinae]